MYHTQCMYNAALRPNIIQAMRSRCAVPKLHGCRTARHFPLAGRGGSSQGRNVPDVHQGKPERACTIMLTKAATTESTAKHSHVSWNKARASLHIAHLEHIVPGCVGYKRAVSIRQSTACTRALRILLTPSMRRHSVR
jgi:hypothetical protein